MDHYLACTKSIIEIMEYGEVKTTPLFSCCHTWLSVIIFCGIGLQILILLPKFKNRLSMFQDFQQNCGPATLGNFVLRVLICLFVSSICSSWAFDNF